jgi:hypothetical protein
LRHKIFHLKIVKINNKEVRPNLVRYLSKRVSPEKAAFAILIPYERPLNISRITFYVHFSTKEDLHFFILEGET